MTYFTIRVELHGASRGDYTTLAEHLSRAGITDIITSDQGDRYRMPPGEYNYSGITTLQQVYDGTITAAARVGKPYAVLVTEAASRKWTGLPTV